MKRTIRIAVVATLAGVLAVAAVVGCWRPGMLRGTPNQGHQLGGDIYETLPGNTIECFVSAIRELECDIRETKDHELIVFHDWDVSGIPNTDHNCSVLGGRPAGQAICDLTLEQVQSLRLAGGAGIPTLEEILETAAEIRPKKPLLLEIKYLHSDDARNRMLELAKRYRDQNAISIHFLAFIRNIQRSFPEPREWLDRFAQNEFCVYQVYRPKTDQYDLCRTWD
jgi:glycerophosphoryl diester phosphodiesterase